MGGRYWNTDRSVDFGADANLLRCKAMANEGELALAESFIAARNSSHSLRDEVYCVRKKRRIS